MFPVILSSIIFVGFLAALAWAFQLRDRLVTRTAQRDCADDLAIGMERMRDNARHLADHRWRLVKQIFAYLIYAQRKRKRFQRETYRLRDRLQRLEEELHNEVDRNVTETVERARLEDEHEVDIRDAHNRMREMSKSVDALTAQLSMANGRIVRLTKERGELSEALSIERMRAKLHEGEDFERPLILPLLAPCSVLPPESEITFRQGQVVAADKKARRTLHNGMAWLEERKSGAPKLELCTFSKCNRPEDIGVHGPCAVVACICRGARRELFCHDFRTTKPKKPANGSRTNGNRTKGKPGRK